MQFSLAEMRETKEGETAAGATTLEENAPERKAAAMRAMRPSTLSRQRKPKARTAPTRRREAGEDPAAQISSEDPLAPNSKLNAQSLVDRQGPACRHREERHCELQADEPLP